MLGFWWGFLGLGGFFWLVFGFGLFIYFLVWGGGCVRTSSLHRQTLSLCAHQTCFTTMGIFCQSYHVMSRKSMKQNWG